MRILFVVLCLAVVQTSAAQLVIHSGQTAFADVSLADSARIATNAVNAYKALGFIVNVADTPAIRQRGGVSEFLRGLLIKPRIIQIVVTKPDGTDTTLTIP